MSESDKEIKKKLQKVLKPFLGPLPSSVERLLHLLDNVSLCLSEVEPDSYMYEVSELVDALVDERFLKHSNVDVKVAVASCITEVTRINIVYAPRIHGDKVKEVLQLIVSSFEHLADINSPSYTKRTSILNTVAQYYVCILMFYCDEYDALLIEMFQNFLKAIRGHHPVKVFLDMESIMTYVLSRSDNIPLELLSTILQYVKEDDDDDEFPKMSRRLAEQVLINSASKCKPYLVEAVKSSGVSLDEYSEVVSLICEREYLAKAAQTRAHKRAHGEMEKTDVEAEPSCRTRKLSKPCSVSDQLAKVKQSIADTLTSVRQFGSELETKEQNIVDTITSLQQFRSELETKEQSIVDTLTNVQQFRSEIKKKEDNLEASLQEVDVLGEKISGINKLLNS